MATARSSSIKRGCGNCIYWRVHVIYNYVGYCTINNVITFNDYICESYRNMKIDGQGLYWCSTCRTRIEGDDARKHLARGHRVYIGAYVDPDVREEIYEAH